MGRKSLFSILVEQPWWVSLLVAGVFYWFIALFSPLVGVAAALPFLCVAAYAGYLRIRRGPPVDVPVMTAALRTASPEEMRAILTEAFTADKYVVSAAAQGDLKLERNGYTTLVRYRRWRAQSVGASAVRELVESMRALGADHGMYITAGTFPDPVRLQAKDADIIAVDGAALTELVKRTGGARKALARAAEQTAKKS